MVAAPIKTNRSDVNEVLDGQHRDPAQVKVTPVYLGVADNPIPSIFQSIVLKAHMRGIGYVDGTVSRAQMFEEGPVYKLSEEGPEFGVTSYLMAFDNAKDEGCSRVHMHTGMRFVVAFTGKDSYIDVISFGPYIYETSVFDAPPNLDYRVEYDSENKRPLHKMTIPPNSMVMIQIPKQVSHGFNAYGLTKGVPIEAAVLSIHPEEYLELKREGMNESSMLAQTIFLQKHMMTAMECYPEEYQEASFHHNIAYILGRIALTIAKAVMFLVHKLTGYPVDDKLALNPPAVVQHNKVKANVPPNVVMTHQSVA